ncbi:hypothetical protein SLA2020_123480 [Shorea laevis]
MTDPDKPWCKALLHKYSQNEHLMHYRISSSTFVTWRSILTCREVLQLGLQWSVGSGNTIKFWIDVWVGDRPLSETALREIPPVQLDAPVSQALNVGSGWNVSFLRQLLPENMVEQILAIPISYSGGQEDSVFWKGSSSGIFSVKSAFMLLQQHHTDLSAQPGNWRWIWKLSCLERIKFFLWLL